MLFRHRRNDGAPKEGQFVQVALACRASGDAGPCQKGEDRAGFVKKHYPDTRVRFGNIRWGDIGATTCDL